MTAWDQFLSSVVFLFLAPVGVLLANILYVRFMAAMAKSTKPSTTVTPKRSDKPSTGRTAEAIRLPQAS